MNVSGFRLRSENLLFSDFVKRVYQNDGHESIINDMTLVEKFYPCLCEKVLDFRLSTGAGAPSMQNYFTCCHEKVLASSNYYWRWIALTVKMQDEGWSLSAEANLRVGV